MHPNFSLFKNCFSKKLTLSIAAFIVFRGVKAQPADQQAAMQAWQNYMTPGKRLPCYENGYKSKTNNEVHRSK
jgi:hypothetical protein